MVTERRVRPMVRIEKGYVLRLVPEFEPKRPGTQNRS